METYYFRIYAVCKRLVNGDFAIEAESRAAAVAKLTALLQSHDYEETRVDAIDDEFPIDWNTRVDLEELTGDAEVYMDTEDDSEWIATFSSENEVEFYQTKED